MRALEVLSQCGAALQVALDFSDLNEAISVASLLPKDPRLFLEAGTPLLKAWGTQAISSLRALRPGAVLVADTKTVDAARTEAEIVKRGGADAFSVLSHSEEALAEAAEAARELGLTLYGDTIASDPRQAMRRLSPHVDVLLLHVGVDVQRRLGITASALLELVREASEAFRGPVAVAGGIKVEEVGKFLEAGARIVVIGSAITRARSPGEEALKALRAMEEIHRCR